MPREPQSCGAFPRLQHRAVELRETKVIGWSRSGDSLALQLDAYVHVSQGKPGIDSGTAWSQRLQMICENIEELQLPEHAPLWISRGEIVIAGTPFERLALPCALLGELEMSLSGDMGLLKTKASALQVAERGEPVFVERFDP